MKNLDELTSKAVKPVKMTNDNKKFAILGKTVFIFFDFSQSKEAFKH